MFHYIHFPFTTIKFFNRMYTISNDLGLIQAFDTKKTDRVQEKLACFCIQMLKGGILCKIDFLQTLSLVKNKAGIVF